MKQAVKLPLTIAITTVLAMSAGLAQQSTETTKVKPGLYVTVDEKEIYMDQGDQRIELATGEAGFASADGMQQLDTVPAFLNWPCGSAFSQGVGSIPTYSITTLSPGDRVAEIAERFFNVPQVPDTLPNWINGDSHGRFTADEISPFISDAYWYTTGKTTPRLASLRPKTLLISLFPSTGQVLVDNNHFEDLRQHYQGQEIPVVFEFNDVNVVPVSYFGPAVSLKNVSEKFIFNQISLAEVPLWYAGDQHFGVSPGEFTEMFDIPSLDNIDPDDLQAIKHELLTNGFTKKPITVIMMAESESMTVDQPAKIAIAQSLGMNIIPTVFFHYAANPTVRRCGPQLPQVQVNNQAGRSGTTQGSLPDVLGPGAAGLTPPERTASKN